MMINQKGRIWPTLSENHVVQSITSCSTVPKIACFGSLESETEVQEAENDGEAAKKSIDESRTANKPSVAGSKQGSSHQEEEVSALLSASKESNHSSKNFPRTRLLCTGGTWTHEKKRNYHSVNDRVITNDFYMRSNSIRDGLSKNSVSEAPLSPLDADLEGMVVMAHDNKKVQGNPCFTTNPVCEDNVTCPIMIQQTDLLSVFSGQKTAPEKNIDPARQNLSPTNDGALEVEILMSRSKKSRLRRALTFLKPKTRHEVQVDIHPVSSAAFSKRLDGEREVSTFNDAPSCSSSLIATDEDTMTRSLLDILSSEEEAAIDRCTGTDKVGRQLNLASEGCRHHALEEVEVCAGEAKKSTRWPRKPFGFILPRTKQRNREARVHVLPVTIDTTKVS